MMTKVTSTGRSKSRLYVMMKWYAKQRGATHFIGACAPSNAAMAKILTERGGVLVDVKDEQGQDVYVNGLGA